MYNLLSSKTQNQTTNIIKHARALSCVRAVGKKTLKSFTNTVIFFYVTECLGLRTYTYTYTDVFACKHTHTHKHTLTKVSHRPA